MMTKSEKKRRAKPPAAQASASKASKPATAAAKPPKSDSKQARIVTMLKSPKGAAIATIMKEMDWQQHSVRGFLAGVVRKKLKLKLDSKMVNGERVYRVSVGGHARRDTKLPERSAV